MSRVVLRGLTKQFGSVTAVDNVDLVVEEGEFLSLLGPSGCGKTSTLRSIAGLDEPTAGEILLGDQVVFSSEKGVQVPPNLRGLGMVFQSYAIWPHLTVAENVAFPLKMRKLKRQEIMARVVEALEMVGLAHLGDRPATKLSGGQQQRVALARAVVSRPKVLLLDEPLSNLDAKLRDRTRFELRRLQQSLGITAIYVTHDQSEAMAVSDRIALMQSGRIIQLARPKELYQRPVSRFVADFVGSANFLRGKILGAGSEGYLHVAGAAGEDLLVPDPGGLQVGEEVLLCLRPEKIEWLRPDAALPAGYNRLAGRVTRWAYLGANVEVWIERPDGELRLFGDGSLEPQTGQEVSIGFLPDACVPLRQ